VAKSPSPELRRLLDGAEFRVIPSPPGYVGRADLEATLTGVRVGREVIRAGAVFSWTDPEGRVHRRAIIATEQPDGQRRRVLWREARLSD